MHHASWMSKVIYSLKIWLFQSQFQLTPREEKGLQDMCVFVVWIYLKAWFTAPLPAKAPYCDLLLLKSLLSYASINLAISKATTKKFSNHLWYLSPELVVLALFDSQVSNTTKRLMINVMKKADSTENDIEQCHTKWITVDLQRDLHVHDFVSVKSKVLFQMMGASGHIFWCRSRHMAVAWRLPTSFIDSECNCSSTWSRRTWSYAHPGIQWSNDKRWGTTSILAASHWTTLADISWQQKKNAGTGRDTLP